MQILQRKVCGDAVWGKEKTIDADERERLKGQSLGVLQNEKNWKRIGFRDGILYPPESRPGSRRVVGGRVVVAGLMSLVVVDDGSR